MTLIITDINRFPEKYRADIKAILMDLSLAHENHRNAHTRMIYAHSSEIVGRSKAIDDATFLVIETYRIQLDYTNEYCSYLENNDLVKYCDG